MKRVTSFVIVAMAFIWLGISRGSADPSPPKDVPQPMVISDLEPKLDSKEVTVKFTITGLDGIAQRAKEGQAPSFAIETDSGKQTNVLSVWIEGELANVLDRLQMSYLQENQLKAGTTVIATGKLTVHKTDPHLYFLSITKWQGFRVLPTMEEK
jgi:hypothetical protein